MDNIEYPKPDNDVNLYHYWKVIAKRKWLFIGLFFIIMLITAIVNFSLPRIYRADIVLKMRTIEFTDLLRKFNINERKNLASIFPKTYNSIEEIRARADTTNHRLKISVDTRDTNVVATILSEILEYVDNSPMYKKSIDQFRERQHNELMEIEKAILYSMEMLNRNSMTSSWSDHIIALHSRSEIINQSLQNSLTTEVTYQYIFDKPVKPQMKRNFILMGIIGFLAVLSLILVGESIRKFRNPILN